MEAGDIVMGTGIAAFSRGPSGRISAWNEAAEAMLGHAAVTVIGKRCHSVIGGRDELGIYCCERCPSWQAAVRGATVQPYNMEIRDAAGRWFKVAVTVLRLSDSSGLSLIHVLERVEDVDVEASPWENFDVEVPEPRPAPRDTDEGPFATG
ncbi:MAG TPA: PAS domain-containing protein [Methylomirabilota bacterium]|nr:PAS domain-containing protein [Methylomirabilota bacterium]